MKKILGKMILIIVFLGIFAIEAYINGVVAMLTSLVIVLIPCLLIALAVWLINS